MGHWLGAAWGNCANTGMMDFSAILRPWSVTVSAVGVCGAPPRVATIHFFELLCPLLKIENFLSLKAHFVPDAGHILES